MAATSEVTRANIRAQGFCGLDDETYAPNDYPLRPSPEICTDLAAVCTAIASLAGLWALAPFAALGAVLPSHPFDVTATRRILVGRLRWRLACRAKRRSDHEEINIGTRCAGLFR